MKKETKQILVVGAGSVGGFFGGHLARVNPNVSFLLRPATFITVNERGLTVRGEKETFTVFPRCASDPQDLPAPDLIILAIKMYDLDEVLAQLTPVLTDCTIFLTLQNGVTVEDELQDRFGRGMVLGGVAFIYSRISEPGVIDHYERGTLMIGEMMGQESPRALEIADLFKQAGISCTISPDIRRAKWEKMCWNCVFNPLTVLMDARVGEVLDHPDMSGVIRNVIEEVSRVAMAHRVPLEKGMSEKVVVSSQEIRDIYSSMYDDVKAGRPTEIGALNGYIVQKGREYGIPTPVNEMLWAVVKARTESHLVSVQCIRIDGEVSRPMQVKTSVFRHMPL